MGKDYSKRFKRRIFTSLIFDILLKLKPYIFNNATINEHSKRVQNISKDKHMKKLFTYNGFASYIIIVFLNAMTDLGHKIIIQDTIFKSFDGI